MRLIAGETLTRIALLPGMPDRYRMMQWMVYQPDFAERYHRARETAIDSYVDEIIDIADDPDLDPADKRVRIDARKWLAGKVKPRKYGDKIDVGLSGEIGLVTDEQLTIRLEVLIHKALGAGVLAIASGEAPADEAEE
jgi:hypothetical protein